ncbi:branched-chain amino acid ABC transporter permease [Puniceibacterium sediminis]|uniref:Amino acid/amide ABC transporter membrane protein 2, HAAT family n=1 Tax=Puniceibacterium sediminis TaxID=1608407 RepID=A0A238WXZ8_9RHOB|nr:branched-chain amino acid ABC transporter permease [Puniceibacterium sediminis]SNR51417.1 amino acid/amide ABC transporter membrane protein 2, HAAT family [Puniceibacterium sediminis]
MSVSAPPTARRPVLMSARIWFALLIFAGFAALPLIAVVTDDPFLLLIGTRILAYAIAAMALDLILGYGAMVSFGHAAYLGFGAYAVAILNSYGVTDLTLHITFAVAISALFATITGAISLRTRGVYFIMITLAFGQMAYFFFVSLSAYGGDDGTPLATRSTLFGSAALEDDRVMFYVALALLIALFIVATRIVGSRFGRVLIGTRENPVRMEAIGLSPFRYQLTAFVISGCMTSVAGVILANQAEFVSPAFMSWHRSGELIVMVVLGGIGNLTGAIGGAVVALLLEDWLAVLTEHWRLLFGVFLILMVLYSPHGITGALERFTRGRK